MLVRDVDFLWLEANSYLNVVFTLVDRAHVVHYIVLPHEDISNQNQVVFIWLIRDTLSVMIKYTYVAIFVNTLAEE